ncbi:MAG: SDR family oxidoreductase [Candidatus Thorarchaeota archaeon]
MTKKYSAILITGAGSGIGKATASLLAERGFQVIATDINKKSFQMFEDDDRINTIKMDVTRREDLKSALSVIIDNNNGLYGLVNGAGVIRLGPVIEAPEEEIMLQFNINTFGMYQVTKEFYHLIKESHS